MEIPAPAASPRVGQETAPEPSRHPKLAWACFGLTLAILVWSGIHPNERFTWFLEVLPVLIAVPLLYFTAKAFPITRVLLIWLTIHGVVLMVGGRYTYAEVPFGDWLRDTLQWERNPYDRIGHLMQGFVPALLTREILRRTSPFRSPAPGTGKPSRWLAFLCVCVALAFSAFYELLEWQAAVWSGEAAESFLGTQGDVWDTQWDMALAAIGAIVSMLVFPRWHEPQLAGH